MYRKIKGKDEYHVTGRRIENAEGKWVPCSTEDLAKENLFLPLKILTGPTGARLRWLQKYFRDKAEELDIKVEAVASRLLGYEFPVIMLQDSDYEKICYIFEKVNSSGLPLSVFELLTAKLYRPGDKGFQLADKWEETVKVCATIREHEIRETIMLQMLAILDSLQGKDLTKPFGCRKKEIFALTTETVQKHWENVTTALDQGLVFMEEHCGVRSGTWFPFPTALPIIAVFFHLFEKDLRGKPAFADFTAKLKRWYFCSVFSNRFASAVETKIVDDIRSIAKWINNDADVPEFIKRFTFDMANLWHVKSRASALYQGIFCLVLNKGARDFHENEVLSQKFFEKEDSPPQDHHIFPKGCSAVKGESEDNINCVFNRTLIDAKTNNIIKNKNPSVYLGLIKKDWTKSDLNRLDNILRSHLIPTGNNDQNSPLESDSFIDFLRAREKLLGSLISEVTGGRVYGYDLKTGEVDPEREEIEKVYGQSY